MRDHRGLKHLTISDNAFGVTVRAVREEINLKL